MIPTTFEYTKAATVADAIAALGNGDGKLLAGGHSLVPALKLRLNQPDRLIDISQIAELRTIHEENGTIVIGAAATHHEIATSALVRSKLPMLADGAGQIGDVQVRNRGTIGGSLAHADPAADWSAMVLAAGATIAVQGSKGTRKIAATDFFTGIFSTALAGDEIITAIHIPILPGARATYQKFAQPASRFAIVGCAAQRAPDGQVHIAFTGLSDAPHRDHAAEAAVSGKPLDAATIAAAAAAAAENVSINVDHYASEKYRKHLAKVYVKRALEAIA
ncbi:MAG: xanthine dehydrogenase family protein subunit M [Saprospiraceae bacterium]|nr:xanthine dehydrogenase family protein subunit M [Saprospiraceae bacterium]